MRSRRRRRRQARSKGQAPPVGAVRRTNNDQLEVNFNLSTIFIKRMRPPQRSRPNGHPSVRWLYRRLAREISQNAIYLHQPSSYRSRPRYERRLTESRQLLMSYLHHLSTQGFISSEMLNILYNNAMLLIQEFRSQDEGYVIGALEGILDSLFPHDEL